MFMGETEDYSYLGCHAHKSLNKWLIVHNGVTPFHNAAPKSYSCEVQNLHCAQETEANEQPQESPRAGCRGTSTQHTLNLLD
jgi:hypothetical protein